MGNQCSYSIRKITEWLDAKELAFNYNSPNLSGGLPEMIQTGLVFKVNDAMYLSVQTHPTIAASAFAETALQNEKGVVYCSELGYDDVIRHTEPEELYEHITQLLELLKEKPADFGADFEPIKRKQKKKQIDDCQDASCHDTSCRDESCATGDDGHEHQHDNNHEDENEEEEDDDNGDDEDGNDLETLNDDLKMLGNDPASMIRTLASLFGKMSKPNIQSEVEATDQLNDLPLHLVYSNDLPLPNTQSDATDQPNDLQNETTKSKIEPCNEPTDTYHETTNHQ